MRALAPAALLALAAAPAAAWYARRVGWGIVEPYELVALATLTAFAAARLRGADRERRRYAALGETELAVLAPRDRGVEGIAPRDRGVISGASRECGVISGARGDSGVINGAPGDSGVVGGALAIAAATVWLGELAAAAVGAVVIALALATGVFGRAARLAAVVLALLALPIVPVLQLHVGYPLRVLASEASAQLLGLALPDIAVEARGPVLALDGALVLVDEPCSGVRALWLALYLGATLALAERLAAARTVVLIGAGVGLAVVLNVLRTVVLAYLDVGHRAADPTTTQDMLVRFEALLGREQLHTALGLALAATLATGSICVARRLGRTDPRRGSDAPRAAQSLPPSAAEPSAHPPLSPAMRRRSWLASGGAIALALAAPLARGSDDVALDAFPGWPATFEGAPLVATPAAPEDRLLAERFSGRIGRFRAGEREVVLAWLAEPTVEVHAASLCFRGAGYAVTPAPAELTAGNTLWGAFAAQRGARSVLVRERVRDEHGRSWPDASAWWWAALLGRTRGPWWREIVVTPAHAERP